MNPNDNNLNINQNNNLPSDTSDLGTNNNSVTNQNTGINSIAPKDEIPLSIEKTSEEVVEPVIQTPVQNTEPVTSIFSQDLNTVSNQTVNNQDTNIQSNTSEATANQDSGSQSSVSENKTDANILFNYQTNAINPNATVNINDFQVDEKEEVKPLPETTNIGNISEVKNVSNEPEPQTLPQPQVTQVNSNSPTPNTNNTMLIAILGVIFAAGLITGAYFVFFRQSSGSETQVVSSAEYKTEKILVKPNTEIKILSDEEYVATVKSYIERYNNNIRNFKVNLATPNLTIDQRLEFYKTYSTEVLDIYSELQNLRVPQNYRDAHDNLTLSLYALNNYFDTLVIEAKNKSLTQAREKEILDFIVKSETEVAKAFSQISEK